MDFNSYSHLAPQSTKIFSLGTADKQDETSVLHSGQIACLTGEYSVQSNSFGIFVSSSSAQNTHPHLQRNLTAYLVFFRSCLCSIILIAIWHLHGKNSFSCFFPRNKLSPSNFRSTSIARNHIILRNIQIRIFKRSYSNLSCATAVLTRKHDYWIFQTISLVHNDFYSSHPPIKHIYSNCSSAYIKYKIKVFVFSFVSVAELNSISGASL